MRSWLALAAIVTASPQKPSATCPSTPELLAFDPMSGSLAVDETFVYYFAVHGAIARVPIDGGDPETLLDGLDTGFTRQLLVDRRDLYWTQLEGARAGIWAMPKGGGRPRQLADAPARALASDGGTLFVAADTIRALPKGGGPAVELAYELADRLALDETFVYFTRQCGELIQLMRVAKSGGPAAQIAEWKSIGATEYLATDDRFVFAAGARDATVWRFEKATGALVKIYEAAGAPWHDDTISAIAADGKHVYVASFTWERWADYHFARLDRDGGNLKLLDDSVPSLILISGDSLYYQRPFNHGPSVVRLCK
jgi:hypothetical protein